MNDEEKVYLMDIITSRVKAEGFDLRESRPIKWVKLNDNHENTPSETVSWTRIFSTLFHVCVNNFYINLKFYIYLKPKLVVVDAIFYRNISRICPSELYNNLIIIRIKKYRNRHTRISLDRFLPDLQLFNFRK